MPLVPWQAIENVQKLSRQAVVVGEALPALRAFLHPEISGPVLSLTDLKF
jgi:hypothetical protein